MVYREPKGTRPCFFGGCPLNSRSTHGKPPFWGVPQEKTPHPLGDQPHGQRVRRRSQGPELGVELHSQRSHLLVRDASAWGVEASGTPSSPPKRNQMLSPNPPPPPTKKKKKYPLWYPQPGASRTLPESGSAPRKPIWAFRPP